MSHPQTLLIEALAVVVVAPLLGVLIPSMRARLIAVGLFLAASFIIEVSLSLATTMDALESAAAVHVTLGASILALAGIGAFCRAACDDALDAIGASILAGVVAAFGVFALGALAADMPTALLNLLLTVNPVVAVASAADIDLFRGALLYQLSPIAHGEFQYPAWQWAAAIYGCVSVAAFVAAARAHRARAGGASTHQLTERGWS
jgi:hypothetical protein